MDIKNLILIIVAVSIFSLGIVLILKNRRSPINLSFSLFFYGASLWSLGLAMFNETLNMEAAASWARIYYFASVIIVVAFLFFANYYIYTLYELNIVRVFYIFLPFLIITFVIFHPSILIESVTHFEWGNDANEKFLGHILFSIYFFIYVIWAYKILFYKFKNAEGINRKNLKLVIVSTMFSYIFGITFDLILPIIGIYRYIWLGPYFTVITLVFLTYLLFYKPSKNI